MSGVGAIDHNQGQIVQNQPLFTEMDSKHCMICPASGIMDNQNAQVIRCDPCFAQRDVFDYGVVLAIACACTKRSEWR